MTMTEEHAWVARYLPGFGNPRDMTADEFDDAMKAIQTIIAAENANTDDARSFVERAAKGAR